MRAAVLLMLLFASTYTKPVSAQDQPDEGTAPPSTPPVGVPPGDDVEIEIEDDAESSTAPSASPTTPESETAAEPDIVDEQEAQQPEPQDGASSTPESDSSVEQGVAATTEEAPPPRQKNAVPPGEVRQGDSEDSRQDQEGQSSCCDRLLGRATGREGSGKHRLDYRRALPRGLGLSGFVQAQYQGSQLSEDQLDSDGHSLNLDTIGVKRARLTLDHGWQYAFVTLEIDGSSFGGASVRLRRAEASLLYRGSVPDDVTPPVVLTAGLTDVPFGAEVAESQLDRLFMEQSLPSRALFPTPADLGVKVWGAYGALEYAVALVNGEPTSVSVDPNAAKDLVGRVGAYVEPLDALDLTGGVSFYVGKGFSPGSAPSKDSSVWIDLNGNGVAEPSEIQGITGSSPVPSENYQRFAVGVDAGVDVALPVGPLNLGGEVFASSNMDRGLLPNDPIVSGADSRQFGASFFATQTFVRHFHVGFRGAFYDPNSNLIEQRAGVFHLRDQTFWELSPVVAVSVAGARLSAEYDFVIDKLGRDAAGVPTDVRNNHFTVRLQVEL